MSTPYQFWNHALEHHHEAFMTPNTPRKTSAASATSSVQSTPSSSVQTHSDGYPFSAGVVFERSGSALSPPRDDMVLAIVKLSPKPPQGAEDGIEELPIRPPRRSFAARIGTRLFGPTNVSQHKAIRVPRSVYDAHFRRDAGKNYIGTEPEREWTEERLMEEFGV